MNKPIPFVLILIGSSLSLTHAEFNIAMSLGISELSQETKAEIINKFNEVAAYELVDEYRKNTPYQDTVEGTLDATTNRGTERRIQDIFVKGSKTGKSWETTTDNVHLLPYTLSANGQQITIDAPILTGTDSNGGTAADNFNVAYSNRENTIADTDDNLYLTITALTAGGISFQVPTGEGDSSVDVYTTPKIVDKRQDYSDQGRRPPAVIMSTANFDQMMQFRKDLAQTINSNSADSIFGQETYLTLDGGVNFSYSMDKMAMEASILIRHPLPFGERESVELISYAPETTFDASLGLLLKYESGRFGASVGVSQIKGNLVLSPIQITDNNGATQNAKYIDHDNSYTRGDTARSITGMSELMYFAEIKAEGSPVDDSGISVYGKYRVGFSSDDTSNLEKIKMTQDGVSIGVIFDLTTVV